MALWIGGGKHEIDVHLPTDAFTFFDTQSPDDHQRWFDGADDLLEPYATEKMSVIPA